MNKNEPKRICKSTIKSKYGITDKELDEADIESTSIRNPHYRSASMITLYDENEIEDLFCKKHTIDKSQMNAKLMQLETEKKERSQMRRNKLEQAKDKRRNKLLEALTKYKLELRNDSKLCQGYIDGTIKNWTIDEIVQRVAECRYLFEHCQMQKYLDIAYEEREKEREQRNRMRREHIERYGRGSWDPDVETAEGSLFDTAERMALKNHGDYPDQWPWMIDINKNNQ